MQPCVCVSAACAVSLVTAAHAQTVYPGAGGAIPDNDDVGNLAAVVIDESYPITSIEVRILGLDHGYSSDLTIELRHNASGGVVTLVSNLRNGEDADFDGDYTFADNGADLWAAGAGVSGTQDLPTGTYQPSGANNAPQSLDDGFLGVDAEGAWVLRVYDDDFLVAGSFESWALVLGGRPACPGDLEGDLDGDGDVGLSDLLTLLARFGESCTD